MKIKNLLLTSFFVIFGCKKELQKENVTHINNETNIGVKTTIKKVDTTHNDTVKITRTTLKKGSRKVIIKETTYYKNNKGDYEIEIRPNGIDTIHIYYDIVTSKTYNIITKKEIQLTINDHEY